MILKKTDCELIDQPPIEKINRAKEALRSQMRPLRETASKVLGKSQGQLITASFFNAVKCGLGVDLDSIVSGYWPASCEIDIRNLMEELTEGSVKICLPVTGRRGSPMTFRSWKIGDKLQLGQYGVRQPEKTKMTLEPDTLIVPLLAFDRFGNRLGYGGGFYDSTLLSLRRKRKILTIGAAFDCQEVSSVPVDDQDQKLDWVITEKRALQMGSV